MVTKAENELLTRTDAGTPGGEMMRMYWHPVFLAHELLMDKPEPIKILGEELVLFRDEHGQPGLMGLYCPHRCADLSYGRIEDGGLRCLYHGWLFDLKGNCIEMPAEPPEVRPNFKHTAYPCIERGGLIFTYMGRDEIPPLLPDYEFLRYTGGQQHLVMSYIDCNYLQGLEGEIDPSHLSYLHRPAAQKDQRAVRGGAQSADGYYRSSTRPKLEIERTDFGVRNYSIRDAEDGKRYVRITNFIMPNKAAIVGNEGRIGEGYTVHWHVPVDDEHHVRFDYVFNRVREVDHVHYDKDIDKELINHRLVRNKANRYMQDRGAMKTDNFTGMGDYFPAHDAFAIETPGAIHDRTREHLGTSDTCIVAARRTLLRAIEDVQAGNDPIHVVREASKTDMSHMQVVSEVIGPGTDHKDIWKNRGASARAAE